MQKNVGDLACDSGSSIDYCVTTVGKQGRNLTFESAFPLPLSHEGSPAYWFYYFKLLILKFHKVFDLLNFLKIIGKTYKKSA